MLRCRLQYHFLFILAAVALNGKLQYAIVEVHSTVEDISAVQGDKRLRTGNVLNGETPLFVIVALDLVATLQKKWGKQLSVKKVLLGSDLENSRSAVSLFYLKTFRA